MSQHTSEAANGSGVLAIVEFLYDSAEFDPVKVQAIADSVREKFRNLPSLNWKIFSVDPERKSAVNVYFWESEAAAVAFFDEGLIERVTGLYGVRPRIQLSRVLV